MTTRDQEEQDLRIDQMTINIEKLRHDMRWETRKFVATAIIGTLTALALGFAAGAAWWAQLHH